MTSAHLSYTYRNGLADEKLIKNYLRSQGLTVTEPTPEQDRMEDTDCFVNGVPVSIKAEHSGARYGNVYFELGQQLTTHADCEYTKSVIGKKNRLSATDVSDLLATNAWEHSWYYTGKADLYYIYQGDKLYIYKKSDIVSHVSQNGFLRHCSLSGYRSSYLGGTYRYCNSICGFLNIDDVRHLSYTVVIGTDGN